MIVFIILFVLFWGGKTWFSHVTCLENQRYGVFKYNRSIYAARVAGIHEMVLALEQGYETQIGEDGMALSAGQRQRVALARALYRDPFLIVLDEPNSNLDSAGEEALAAAIRCVRKRGGIVAVIAHRAATLAEVDTVLLMVAGRVCAFGPREKVLAKVTQMDSGDRSGSGRHRVDVA